MRQTRRGFVGGAAAIGATALLPWGARAQGQPTRQSLAQFSKDPARVASLRKGVAVMKARAPSDPKSWFFQSAIHAYNDAAYADAYARDPAIAQVDGKRFWNKCPHFGQSSAEFLIWHRAYLHVFERVLREAAEDPMLALPYWDYSQEDGREFPVIFADEFLDARQTDANPLYHPNREQAFVTGRFDISQEVGEARATMAAQSFFSDVGAPGFAGDILDSRHTQLGLIEQRPHNDIHIAVGGAIGSVNGAMADIPTAAFDPVFWVHHANIDRLWAEWSCMPEKSWGPLPPSPWLDEEPWEFIDVDGSIRRGSRRFYMDRVNIAVFYDTDKLHGPPMALPPPPVMAAAPPPPVIFEGGPIVRGAAPANEVAQVQDRELVADATPVTASPRKAALHALPVTPAPVTTATPPPPPPPAPSGNIGGHAARGAAPTSTETVVATAAVTRRVVLELSDISYKRLPSSGFAVYLASADDIATGKRGTFVGLLDLFGVTHGHMAGMEGMGAVQRFDVTRIVAREGLNLAIRVEPYDLLVSKGGAPAPARADAVKIGKVRFVEMT